MRSVKIRFLIVLSCLVVFLHGCGWYGANPGYGNVAQKYYQRSEPIIDALEKYKLNTGEYPDKLEKLVPHYLATLDWPDGAYRLTEDSYILFFTYEGPGANGCSYRPVLGWKCMGLL